MAVPAPDTEQPAAADQQQSYTLRNTPERPYRCNLCSGSSFSSEENLSKHKLERHSSQQSDLLEEVVQEEDQPVQPQPSQNIKVYKKKCANLMDKINRLAGSKSGKVQQEASEEAGDEAVVPAAATATAAGIFSEMLGVKPSSIDKLFSNPNSAASILGLSDKPKDKDQENV